MFPFVSEINFAGWFHLVFFGLLIPAGAFIQGRKFGKPDSSLPNRLLHFQSTALTIVMLGALSLMVARWEGLRLFPRVLPNWRAIGAGVLMFIGALAYMRPRWRRAVERRARVVYLYMPANATERLWWIVVAVLAGVGGWAGAVVSRDLDTRDATAAGGFANVMKDLPSVTKKGGMLYVFRLP